MILDTIARSAGKRVEQRKQVKPLEQMMKEAFKCSCLLYTSDAADE